jgi:hypothetical protein
MRTPYSRYVSFGSVDLSLTKWYVPCRSNVKIDNVDKSYAEQLFDMRQAKVSLDDHDVRLLEEAADGAGRSLSEEIRSRLRASLSPEIMGVSLPDNLRKMLQDACPAGRNVGEVIRARLWRTFKMDAVDKPLRNFMAEVGILVTFARLQTGQDCETHPAASAVLRHAINARLARKKESGPETFAPGELPSPNQRLVSAGSDDPETMGASLEARLQSMIEFQEMDAESLLLETAWEVSEKLKKLKEGKRDGT